MLYTLALPLYDRYYMVQAPGLPLCDIVGRQVFGSFLFLTVVRCEV